MRHQPKSTLVTLGPICMHAMKRMKAKLGSFSGIMSKCGVLNLRQVTR